MHLPRLLKFLILSVIFSCNAPYVFSQLTTVWEKRYGNAGEISKDASITTDGTIIVVGKSVTDGGDVSGHHGNIGVSDAWVIKLDTVGNLLWQKSIGGSGNDVFNMVFTTEDSGYICIGSSQSNDGDLQGNANVFGAWVVKISVAGNVQWSKTYGGTGCNSAVLMDNGNIGLVVENGANRSVLQLDTSGNIIWQSQSNSLTGKFITETNDHKLLTSTGLMFDAATGDTLRFAGFPTSEPALEIQALKRLNNRIYIAVKDSYGNRVGYFDTTSGNFIYSIWSKDEPIPEWGSIDFSVCNNNCLDAFPAGEYIVSGYSHVATRGGDFYTPVFNTNEVTYAYQGNDVAQVNSVKGFSTGNEILFCGWAWYENKFWIAKLKAEGVVVNWIGGESNAWEDSRNWTNGMVPTRGTKVIIPANSLSFPVVNSNAICFSLQVDSGASITVNTGFNIEITGK